jgi:D-alanyl-D-alanine carboxypeptidase
LNSISSFTAALLAALALIGPHRAAGESPKPTVPTAFDVAKIDAFVAAQAKTSGWPGLAVAVMRDGKVELTKGYGFGSLERRTPVTPETRFAIASVTKQFTSVCILLLAEDGKLSVHDKVAKYFPDLTRANDISLLDLMQHVSGYPDYYPLDFTNRAQAKPIAADDLIQKFARGPLDFEPGTKWSYSNTGFIILGRVVEMASGESFGGFLERRIFRPLQMSRTSYEPEAKAEENARGYARPTLGSWEPATPEALGWMGAAGAICTTAPDLLKWDLALMDGRVLHPESFELMTTQRRLSGGRLTGYGCGVGIRQLHGRMVLSHSGAVNGFASWNFLVPATKSAVVVLTNCEDTTEKVFEALDDLVLLDPSDVPKISGPDAVDAARNIFLQLQSGRIDRKRLGDEFNAYLTDTMVRRLAASLKGYGAPTEVVVDRIRERGAMEVASVSIKFRSGELTAVMFRSPDGQIQQFLLSK